jgi:Coenzyme PQQ synthesis protein D (PqqD)
MADTISRRSTLAAVKEQVTADLAGEVAILHLEAGVYFGLDGVGARIWALIQQPSTVDEVLATLLAEYEVDAARCEQDLLALVGELSAANLIEVGGETAA